MKQKTIKDMENLIRHRMDRRASAAEETEHREESVIILAQSADQVKKYFTKRDMTQIPNLSAAVKHSLKDNEELRIEKEGTYILSGTGRNASVTVAADKKAKVQLVLDGAKITNAGKPCIYVKKAHKVFITVMEGRDNTLTVTGDFRQDGRIKTDAVIFSKADLVFNGTGSLTIHSSHNGITSKDGLKITGGTIAVNAEANGIEAKSAIRIAGGDLTVNAGNDGIQAKDNHDDTEGVLYIMDGTLDVKCVDDVLHAVREITIDGGTLHLFGREGIESTVVTINGGDFTILASDDGINAGRKSRAVPPVITINGGMIRITTDGEQPDGIDSNGDIVINGGTIDITSDSAFDCTGKAEYNGGTIFINGERVDSIPITR